MMNARESNSDPRPELGRADTHEIGFWPANRLIAQSSGRGWKNVYAALATVNSWSGTLAPTGHPCLAYCLHRPAQLRRRIESSGTIEIRTIRPREFFMIPAHEATDWQRHGSSDMLMLYLRQDLIDAVSRASRSTSGRGLSVDMGLGTTDPLMEQLALAMLRALQAPEDGSSALYVEGLVQCIALHLVHARTPATEHPPKRPAVDSPAIRRATDLIEAKLDGDLSIAVLARETGVPPQAFARSFLRTFGTTVHQYVLMRRLERAKSLLISTDLPIIEVALQAGFSSQSHLSTAFKRLTGMTPGQYQGSTSPP